MNRIFRDLLANALLLAIYYCAGKLGLTLALDHGNATSVWPPTGISIAAILLLGYRVTPAIFLGAFLVNYTHPNTAGDVVICARIGLGNLLEAVVAAALARRFCGGGTAFNKAAEIFHFVFLAAIVSTAISATMGVTTLASYKSADYRATFFTWWLGDAVSAIVLTPLLVIWAKRPWVEFTSRIPEAVTLLALLIICGQIIFGGWLPAISHSPIEYLCMPLLLWAVFRFRQAGASLAAFVISVLAIIGTRNGLGPFAVATTNESLLLLQSFMAVVTLTVLVLAAVVAEREHAGDAFIANQQRLRMALDAAHMGTWEWTIATGRVEWSPGLEAIHGLGAGEFPGTFEAFLADIHPDDRDDVQRRISSTIADRTDHHIQYRLQLKDGTIRWVEGRGRVAVDASGEPQRLVGVCMDVTERRLFEQQRDQLLAKEHAARTEAEKSARIKDEFLAVLSHELRTPLTPVLLTTSMLEADPTVPAEFREDIKLIRRNVELEARLIDDLLDLSRVAKGKLQLSPESVDVHPLLDSVMEICKRENGARVIAKLEAKRHLVWVDPARLQQVFWNLLNNAQKFTPAGGTITITTADAGEDAIGIEFADTGAGISAELLPRLFDAFSQGPERAGGLGLGLAISKALVDAAGGKLTAASPGKGHGATFRIELRTLKQDMEPASDAPEAPAPMRVRGLRVLLVEDHQPTQIVLQKLLATMGHQLTSAPSIKSALDLADRQPFDLVISDIGLPDGSGHELMREIKQRHGFAGIALSGYGMDEDIQRSREAGFSQHLTKPIDLQKLQRAIEQATTTA